MFELKKNQEFPIKKCKNFGYTFSVLFLLLACYFFFNKNSLFFFFFFISVVFFLLTFFLPSYLKLLAFYWERFGIVLSKIFSPIVLILVYTITIIPINLILRIFSLDLLKRRRNNKAKSYWIKRLDEKINFRNQF
tara:strand:+ start:1152 stop:1556 length:405 start_codon:yes stop_codon:yes gene_type:complete